MSVKIISRNPHSLRACLLCSMVKTLEQFENDGCENCERYLRMKGNHKAVTEYTSSNFDKLIVVSSLKERWVPKWKMITRYAKGCYALSVSGSLPPETAWQLKQHGITYATSESKNRKL